LSHSSLPFGDFWYEAAYCDNLAACAVIVMPSIAATPAAAPAAILNR
jgi:hypothetical protein